MKRVGEILKERTAEAARPLQEQGDAEGIDIIRFTVGNETYAIEAALLSEVHSFREPTPVPYLPPYILGILYMRGRFVSVVELKRFLEIGEGSEARPRSLLLLDDGKMEFGIAVDEVLEEGRLAKNVLQPVASGFALARKELIAGVTEEGTVLLDGRHLLADPSMVIHQEIITSRKGGIHAQ